MSIGNTLIKEVIVIKGSQCFLTCKIPHTIDQSSTVTEESKTLRVSLPTICKQCWIYFYFLQRLQIRQDASFHLAVNTELLPKYNKKKNIRVTIKF